jgi:MFS family permease
LIWVGLIGLQWEASAEIYGMAALIPSRSLAALAQGLSVGSGHSLRYPPVIPAPHARGTSTSFPWLLVLALALAQLVAWGTLYYAFAILINPMGAEFGWSSAEMSGALSSGLGVTGISSYGVGRWIDRHGGRGLMALGSLLGAALLALWSQITELWQLYAIWCGMGVARAMVLYDPVFAVVARVLPADYRRAITTITLLGGLASTVFIPLTQELVEISGWRHALLILALIELPLCAGIPWVLLRGREAAVPPMHPLKGNLGVGGVSRAVRHPVFWLLVASYVSSALFYTALLFNLVPMLHERGFTTGGAIAVYAFIGPAQVVGRIAMLTLERLLTVKIAGLAGTLLPVLAMFILSVSEPGSLSVFVFAIAFGAGLGIKTVVQATAAPEFLGRSGYGAMQGAIVMPVYAAQAISPFAAAVIRHLGDGYRLLEGVLLLSVLISALAFSLAALLAPKARLSQLIEK